MAMQRAVRVQDRQAPDRADQGAAWRCHRRQRPGADPQAVRRTREQVRGLCLDADPQARPAAQAAGDDRQGHQRSADMRWSASASSSFVTLALKLRGAPLHAVASARHLLRRRRAALRHRPDDQAPDQQVQFELPRRDRADGARPAVGPSDHRDARHRRQRNSRPGRGRVPHGRGQDEDRPDDGGRRSRRPPTASARPNSSSSSSRWRSSARPAATLPRPCRTLPTCFASARR